MATQAVYEYLKARRKGPEVLLPGLPESSFRGTLAPKHVSSRFGAYLQNVGHRRLVPLHPWTRIRRSLS